MPTKRQLTTLAINFIKNRFSDKSNKYAWFIGKHKNSKMFYMADSDNNNNAVLWTKSKTDAVQFKTEALARNFINTDLNKRTDITLIQTSTD